MLTSGDIQFEPTAGPKVLLLSTSIAVMQSGDQAFNSEILRDLVRIVTERINQNPTDWWLIEDIVKLYVKCRNDAKRLRAEAAILAPLNLTIDNYLSEIHKLDSRNAETLLRDLITFEVPHTSVIVTGIDPYGAHIYVVDDGDVSCNDIVGFAAIGSGFRHAVSQLMLARHSWNSPFVDTALLAYIAKKRSEVAPGVGEATDMFSAGPALGTLRSLSEEAMARFERIYKELREKEDRCRDEARQEANDFVNEAAARAAERAQRQEPGSEGETLALENKPSADGEAG
jgi:hypothetical protein